MRGIRTESKETLAEPGFIRLRLIRVSTRRTGGTPTLHLCAHPRVTATARLHLHFGRVDRDGRRVRREAAIVRV